MKKTLSLILSIAMLLTAVTFVQSPVSADEHGIYTTIDISGMLNSKAFLSTSTAGTVTDGEAVWPHFFIKSISAGVSTAPYAISKESIDSKLTNGTLYWNGIPFNVVTLDNQKSVLGATNSRVKIPLGYYSKFYFLCASPDNFYTGSSYTSGENIYRNIYGPTAGQKSTNWLSTDLVCDLDFAKVKASDELSGNPKLMVRSYEVMDKTNAYNEISVGIEGHYSTRVLAVTVESLKASEWDPIIEAKLATLPESISELSYDDYSELTALIEQASSTGADVSSMSGIDKYYRIKSLFDNIYKTVDIPLTSKGYLSAQTAGTVTDGEAQWPHFFLRSPATTGPYAISKESIDALLTDGIFTWNGIPFSVKTLDNQNSMMGTTNDRIQIPLSCYSKFYFLCASPDNCYTGGSYTSGENIYRTMHGPNGQSSTNWLSTDYVCDLEAAKVRASDEPGSNIKLMVRSYEVLDKTKAGNELSAWVDGAYSTRILAATVVELIGSEWNEVLEPKFAALPQSTADPSFDQDVFNELTVLIERARTNGADVDRMTGINKYNALKAELDALDGIQDCVIAPLDDSITIDLTFVEGIGITAADITKANFALECGREDVDYSLTAITENGNVKGARITLDNYYFGPDTYQLDAVVSGKCDFNTIFNVPKPITVSDCYLKNSSGKIVDRPSDIVNGQLKFTADVTNNSYAGGKNVKIISAVYDGGKLYAVDIADANIAYKNTYKLNASFTVPTEGLDEAWSAAAFIWNNDMITPFVKKASKTYGIDALNDPSKDLKVAFIGGSITEGRNYTDPFIRKWQADRTGTISVRNAGIGGTDSSYGTMRMYEDVLSWEPDIVFVEFTLNDKYLNEVQIKQNVESMIRQCYDREHQPVIAFIHIPDRRITNGEYDLNTNIAYYNSVLSYYGLTPFNAQQLVVDAINAPNSAYTWDSFLTEGNVHPDAQQGENIATVMYNDFAANYSDYVKNIVWNPVKGYNSDTYSEPKTVASNKAKYDSSWTNSKNDIYGVVTEGYGVPTSIPFESFMAASDEGAQMSFKFKGTKIMISSLRGRLGKNASYTVTNSLGEIEKSGTITTFIEGYNWYENTILKVTGLADAEHTLTIKVQSGDGLFGIGEFWVDE